MSLAYQQQQRRQQQVVHHEPQLSVVPSRSTTEAPEHDERYASAGNGERVSMAGLDEGGEGGQAAAPPPGAGMDTLRDHVATEAAADPFAIGPADLAAGFLGAEEGLLAGADGCVEAMAGFEDASRRWYHLGRGQECYERERPVYERDLREHQRLALDARHDGLRVELTARVVDEALIEARAAMLLLSDQGVARPDETGKLVLDPAAVDAQLDSVREAFSSTGFEPGQESAEGDLRAGAPEAVDALMVQAHGLGFALSGMRAQAQSRKAGAVRDEKERIERIVATCDRMGSLLKSATAVVAMAQAGSAPSGRSQHGGRASDPLDPFALPGLCARAIVEDELHALAAQLEALGAAEEGWGELAHSEQVQDAVGEYREAMQRVVEHDASAQAQRDDYVAGLGNLGRTMDLDAMVRGQPGARERCTGDAMAALARIRATHLSLAGARETIDATNQRLGQSAAEVGAFTGGRTGQAELDRLRGQQRGVSVYYLSVRLGLDAKAAEVARQDDVLAGASEAFGAVLGGRG